MLKELIREKFSFYTKPLSKAISRVLYAMLFAKNANTFSIANTLCLLEKKDNVSFNTADKLIWRLFKNPKFQINETLFRLLFGFIMRCLSNLKLISPGQLLNIKVDFTSIKDNFLILCASIITPIGNFPIYFSMRKYPKKAGKLNQKKMEDAFLGALKHLLSKKYKYRIIADRGFGNQRIKNLCEHLGFKYVLRLREKLYIKLAKSADKTQLLTKAIKKDGKYRIWVEYWQSWQNIVRISKAGKVWYLLCNEEDTAEQAQEIYKKRFMIERIFKELKSAGFDIERIKIRKYDRFKRILYLSLFAYAITLFVGHLTKNKLKRYKKKLLDWEKICYALLHLPEDCYKHLEKKLSNL